MTIERSPLCTVSYCPAPTDPDAHVCPHCQGNAVQHQHVVPRGMGGSLNRKYDRANVVMICAWVHEEITMSRLSDGFYMDGDGVKWYRIWDIHNETACEYAPYWIQGASAGVDTTPQEVARKAPSAEAPKGPDEESIMGVTANPPRPGTRTPYAKWENEGEALFHARRKVPWAEGDWLVEGEKQFGDLYVQGWSRLGLQQSAVDQRMNLAEAFPEKHRVPDASWSHHRVAITVTPREEQRSWLLAAVRNGWSDREFKQALILAEVLTPRPKKRTIITCPACKHKAPKEDYGHENVPSK